MSWFRKERLEERYYEIGFIISCDIKEKLLPSIRACLRYFYAIATYTAVAVRVFNSGQRNSSESDVSLSAILQYENVVGIQEIRYLQERCLPRTAF